jgi:large subunit ribosomal protein L19
MKTALLEKVEQSQLKEKAPEFQIGDSVRVHVKIKEGDKERIQLYAGTVIARDGGGSTETFTVRHISYGEGVERVFPLHSPYVTKVEVERSGVVRRAKLYYLRDRTSKQSRLKEAQA